VRARQVGQPAGATRDRLPAIFDEQSPEDSSVVNQAIGRRIAV
jgi:hypothetical protein